MESVPQNSNITVKKRIESIDVFRGLTIFVMIFVNDLAGVRNIPMWMKHVPENADGMTFVDVVFPAFLFIVGMAIPFALNKRIKSGDTIWQIWKHILIRTAGLLVLGIMMVNISGLNQAATGMGRYVWMILMFIAAILTWNQYPPADGTKKKVYSILKYGGIIMLVVLAAIYRSGTEGNLGWLHTKWWGILGLIGWAYLTTSALYLLFRKQFGAMIGMMAMMIALYIGDKGGALDFLGVVKDTLWFGGHIGGHVSITLAGTIVSMLFLEHSPVKTPQKRITWILTFAGTLFIAGYFLRPLYGISKIYSTPTWSLYSAGYSCLIYAFLYWLVDLKGVIKWAKFLEPAGKNPLMAYILPDIFYGIIWLFGITFLSKYLGEGIVGIIRSLVFSLIMLGVTAWFNKMKIRLHL